MRNVRNDCIESRLRYLFFEYGKIVVNYHYVFILIPLIFAAGMGGGYAYMVQEENVIYLYTPTLSAARTDQIQLHKILTPHVEEQGFDPIRTLDLDSEARVIITHKNNGSIWEQPLLQEIYQLDDFIKSTRTDATLYSAGISYDSICAKDVHKQCYTPEGLSDIRSSSNLSGIRYPTHYKPTGPGKPDRKVFMGFLLGGVETDDNGYVTKVEALQLTYYFQNTTDVRPWFKKFASRMESKTFTHIKVDYSHSYFLEEELIESTDAIIPYYSFVFIVLSIFAIASTTVFDPVRSKPVLGLCGVISAGLAILSAGGLLMYCGLPYTDLVAGAPFLALGIGVDDMFVMLAAWRKTDHYSDMALRFPEALSQAAMSITITSVTDVLAIGIGLITPFPAVKLFAIYTCLMIVFDYIFQITFFAGCMAVSGLREQANRHGVTCMKVLPKSQAANRSDRYSRWCAGGVSRSEPNYEVDKTEVYMMVWFRDKFSGLVTHPFSKGVVIFLSLVYLAFAIWGCFLVTHGTELNHLLPDESRSAQFYAKQQTYFGEFTHHVQLTINDPLDNEEAFDNVKEIVKKLEDSEYFRGEQHTISWLRDYEDYAAKNGIPIDYEKFFDENFKRFLNEEAYADYKRDAHWEKEIFRFILTPAPAYTNKEARMQMKYSREMVREAGYFKAIVYSPRYIFVEQYVEIFSNTLVDLEISICTVLGVSILLIPSPLVSLWITFSIGSILFGVVGYMGLWRVNLDPVSLTQLIVCVGFSVDYTFHITYAFVDSDRYSRDERAEDSLYSIGLPILQGAVSTLISIAPLSTSNTYIYTAFCKIIFLAICFATVHGLIILPVLLSLFGPRGTRPEQVSLQMDHFLQ